MEVGFNAIAWEIVPKYKTTISLFVEVGFNAWKIVQKYKSYITIIVFNTWAFVFYENLLCICYKCTTKLFVEVSFIPIA